MESADRTPCLSTTIPTTQTHAAPLRFREVDRTSPCVESLEDCFYLFKMPIEISAVGENVVEVILDPSALQFSQHVCDHASRCRLQYRQAKAAPHRLPQLLERVSERRFVSIIFCDENPDAKPMENKPPTTMSPLKKSLQVAQPTTVSLYAAIKGAIILAQLENAVLLHSATHLAAHADVNLPISVPLLAY